MIEVPFVTVLETVVDLDSAKPVVCAEPSVTTLLFDKLSPETLVWLTPLSTPLVLVLL